MKISIYIVTYKDEIHLNTNLEWLFNSDLSQHDVEVNIISNHTQFVLHDEFKDRVNVIHNILSPDENIGNTARCWNQSILHGFRDLNNPRRDLVICAQDDTQYNHDWLNWLVEHHQKGLEFIASGIGDNCCLYSPEAVKTIGLWDERFCVLSYSECDYFLRAVKYLGNRAAINDVTHGSAYTWNKIERSEFMIFRPTFSADKVEETVRRSKHSYIVDYSRNLFMDKWHRDPATIIISRDANLLENTPKIKTPFFYIWFEKNINNLQEKGYYSLEFQ